MLGHQLARSVRQLGTISGVVTIVVGAVVDVVEVVEVEPEALHFAQHDSFLSRYLHSETSMSLHHS